MKWWKDLWLNESFADFISHFCLDHIKNKVKSIDLENIWAKFNARKGNLYFFIRFKNFKIFYMKLLVYF